jgi:uncharacterized membrane protein
VNPKVKSWIITFIIAGLLFGTTYLLRGQFNLYGVSDALILPGAIFLSYAGLRSVTRTGVYDVSGYGISRFRDAFRRDQQKTYDSVYEYKEIKQQRRQSRAPYMAPQVIVGILCIALSLWVATLV